MRPLVPLVVLLLLSAAVPLSRGHNITQILSHHPDFSTFNHYLTATHLAGEINRRQTITVLALNNAAMSSVLSKHLPLQTLKNLLSLHVLVDYFGAKKLHQITGGTALVSTVFQSSGQAQGMAGFVNVTDHRGGHVSFSADGSEVSSAYVKSIREIPYNISVVEISKPLVSDAAEAPTPSPADIDFIDIMSKKGCKTFADLLTAENVTETLKDKVDTGLTIFCPIDQAMEAFMPKFNNLSTDRQTSILLYHAIAEYKSMEMLKSDTDVMHTLATEGKSHSYNFTVESAGEVVTLKTKVTTARVTGTLVDEDPLAVYTIDEVLEPRELFKPEKTKAKAPAPAPQAEADAPEVAESPRGGRGGKSKKRHVHALPSAPTPAGPEEQPEDDEVADESVGWRRVSVQQWAVVAAAAGLVMIA